MTERSHPADPPSREHVFTDDVITVQHDARTRAQRVEEIPILHGIM